MSLALKHDQCWHVHVCLFPFIKHLCGVHVAQGLCTVNLKLGFTSVRFLTFKSLFPALLYFRCKLYNQGYPSSLSLQNQLHDYKECILPFVYLRIPRGGMDANMSWLHCGVNGHSPFSCPLTEGWSDGR